MRKVIVGLMVAASWCATSIAQSRIQSQASIERIAFGSCYRTERDSTVWTTIASREPDVMILLGDNVYADTFDEAELRAAWKALGDTESFAALRETTTLLATWDDHDFGENDAGREYPIRAESQRAMLDFLGEPEDSERRMREGVYESYLFGPEGRRVQVILLDTRYHRSPLIKREARGAYADGRHGWYLQDDSASATMLGEAQWAWLERVLREPADLRIIASSIQVVAEDHYWERWDEFPRERARLLRLISETDASGVMFITGDRHKAEVSLLDVERMEEAERVDVGYPIYDVTSSSLNAPLGGFSNEINRHRFGRVYDGPNFGEIVIDWDAAPSPVVTMQILDSLTGRVMVRHGIELSELRR